MEWWQRSWTRCRRRPTCLRGIVGCYWGWATPHACPSRSSAGEDTRGWVVVNDAQWLLMWCTSFRSTARLKLDAKFNQRIGNVVAAMLVRYCLMRLRCMPLFLTSVWRGAGNFGRPRCETRGPTLVCGYQSRPCHVTPQRTVPATVRIVAGAPSWPRYAPCLPWRTCDVTAHALTRVMVVTPCSAVVRQLAGRGCVE